MSRVEMAVDLSGECQEEDAGGARRQSRRLASARKRQKLQEEHEQEARTDSSRGVVDVHRPIAGASAFRNDCGILPSE